LAERRDAIARLEPQGARTTSALILPHRASPRRMDFSGITTIRDPILPAELTWFLAMT
jgi:hypothetical protein